MAGPNDDAYDDEPSAAELKVLDTWTQDGPEPPAADADGAGNSVDQALVDAGQDPAAVAAAAAAAAKDPAAVDPAAAAAAAGGGAAAAAAEPDAEMAAFLERHKGKPPEELARLLWQQSKRAAGSGFQARKSQEQVRGMVTAASEALTRRRADIARRRAEFDEKVKNDPDGALRDAAETRFQEEEAAAEADLHNARVDAALELAATAIPDFANAIKPTLLFGTEMGYSREEIGGITDGRDLVVLYLAERFGNLVKAGICDVRGNLLQQARPVNEQPQDPRLQVPDPVSTLSTAPGRTGAGGETVEGKLSDVLKLSDADFDKLPAATLENLLKAAG